MYYSMNLDNITPHNEFVSQTYGGGISEEVSLINGSRNGILHDMTKTYVEPRFSDSKKFGDRKDSDMKSEFL